MNLTRRAFSSGLMALFGSSAAPLRPAAILGSLSPSASDMTFEALLSELITSEEAAINGGQVVQAGRGASSWYGRQIEGYLGEVDLRVDIATSAKDLLAEFRSRVMSDAKQARTLRVGDGPELPREERPEQLSSDLDAREKTTEICEEQVFTSSPACDVCPADARTTA